MKTLKQLWRQAVVLQRSIPGVVLAAFFVAIVSMNMLANKSIDFDVPWMALDMGVIFSWVVFLVMDMVTKHFGPKAADLMCVMALIMNLFVAVMFYIGSLIPGTWGESYVDGSEVLLNTAINNTFRGTWFVLFGSSVAFLLSGILNNWMNWAIGKRAEKLGDNFGVFILRAYVSTFIGQFIDNLIFALIVSLHLFGWTLTQCFVCAITTGLVELLFEIVFSPIGYQAVKRWKRDNVGAEYFAFLAGR